MGSILPRRKCNVVDYSWIIAKKKSQTKCEKNVGHCTLAFEKPFIPVLGYLCSPSFKTALEDDD